MTTKTEKPMHMVGPDWKALCGATGPGHYTATSAIVTCPGCQTEYAELRHA